MNFSFDASKAQGTMPATTTPATPGMPGFTFGTSGGGDTGKPLSTGFPIMSTPSQVKPSGLFSTGISGTTAPSTGFTFGSPNTSALPTGGTLGTAAAPPQSSVLTFGAVSTPGTAIGFGPTNTTPAVGLATPTGSTPSFTLGGAPTVTSGAATGLTFGTPKAGTGFTLGGGENVPAAGTTALPFGTPNAPGTLFGASAATPTTTITTTVSNFNLGSNATSTTTATGLTFDLPKMPQQPIGAGFAAFPSTTTSAQGFSLGTPATTSTTGFSLGGGTTAITTTGFALSKTTTPASSATFTATTTPSLGTTTTVSSSATGTQPGAINFCQLEEAINKWTLELEEQEKVFMNQATQVNVWDKLLITNGEKIVTLNQEVERVKIEQKQLEQELDYVVGQQKELQDCLVPLEKELASLSVLDPEREYTYHLAENLDTQLKQMSEDLKEIIEHLNEANRTQDSSDPIVQIGKVLNAHMNSLQWLDQRTALLSQKIQQIDQMHQNFRQENERSFSLAYN